MLGKISSKVFILTLALVWQGKCFTSASYKKVQVDLVSFNLGLLKTFSSISSQIECGSLCSANPPCKIFLYIKRKHDCRLSSGSLIEPPDTFPIDVFALQELAASKCTSALYKKSNGITACLIDIHQSLTFQDGNSVCHGMAARIPEVLDPNEQATITKLKPFPMFLGATDIANEGSWVWQDSLLPVTYSNWAPGEPNGGILINCLWIQSNGKWEDTFCRDAVFNTIHHPIVCEKLWWKEY